MKRYTFPPSLTCYIIVIIILEKSFYPAYLATMKVIIVGAGTVGFQIAKQLIAEKKDVVLIDSDSDRSKYASNNLDCMVINKTGNNIDVLKKAGIEKTDFFIAVTNSDEMNMICCGLVADEFDVPHKIARVRNIDYFNSSILQKPFLGIDYIINSEIEAAKKFINAIEYGAVSDIISFENTDIQMRNIVVSEYSFFRNKTVQQVKESISEEFLIAGVVRQEEFIIPSGETTITENDNIYILASKNNLNSIFNKVDKKLTSIRKIIIVGGGRIGRFIAEHFLETSDTFPGMFRKILPFFKQKNSKTIKIIDKDYQKCKNLANFFPGHQIINADISDESIFGEEKLSEYDLIITTTKNQEMNVLTGVYAKTLGIKRAMSLVRNINYINIASRLGIDVVVSPKQSIINPILKFIRQGNVHSIHSISDSDVEVMEVTIEKNCPLAGRKIKDIRFPGKSLVLSIIRESEHIIPDGDFLIEGGDHVIIMARHESIQKIDKMVVCK